MEGHVCINLVAYWCIYAQTHYLCYKTIVYFTLVPLGGVRNLLLIDPTFTTLTATWDAADGNVQGYKVLYVPTNGGTELIVGISEYFKVCLYSVDVTSGNLSKI